MDVYELGIHWYSLAMNNVSSSDVIVTPPSQTQPGLLATAVPHSIPAKPRKVCTLSMTVNVVVCAYFILCDDVITSHVISHQLTVQCRPSHVISHQLTVQCRQKKRALRNMTRGSAATDGRYVYITPVGSDLVYQYECSTKKWMELPSCPYGNSGLAIIDSELTTVGGGNRDGRTNRLFTLRQGKWVEEVYPPMNTARYSLAVVSTSDGDYHITIGGWVSDGETATVEIFQVKSRRWYKLTDLPQPLPCPSATICGDQLHVIGIDGMDGKGYSCSLQSLPSNDRPITSPLTLSWKPLPPLPVRASTAATLCGQLVLIGGVQGLSPVNSIHQLVEGQWVEIGSMTSVRHWCLAVSPSPDRILIVGGFGARDSVEECVAV